jgi:3'-phosphoadenosine 5'-phosphosulfate sulfotransferase (PAPS reductase)/FAD synthetase
MDPEKKKKKKKELTEAQLREISEHNVPRLSSIPRSSPSAEFLAQWSEHYARENQRASEQVARQIVEGTRSAPRRHTKLPMVGRKPDTAKLRELSEYDYIIVAFSGGKDSLACVLRLIDLGVPRERIELWHYCVDGQPGSPRFFDWPVTESYCSAVAQALGLRLLFRWREGGFKGELLKRDARSAPVGIQMLDGNVKWAGGKNGDVTTQGKFPRQGTIDRGRWCSGLLKVDVSRLALNNDPRFRGKRVLLLSGERGEESGNRARYPFVEADYTNSGRKEVTVWHAVLEWYEPEVWDLIRRHRVRPHPAYYVGFSRLSCMPCIFGNNDQWATVQSLDPSLLDQIAAYEHFFYKSAESPGTIGTGVIVDAQGVEKPADVVLRAARGVSYLDERHGSTESADAHAWSLLAAEQAAELAMGEYYPTDLVIVPPTEQWVLPRGAGRKSGGPT